jgi:hypothetical protein
MATSALKCCRPSASAASEQVSELISPVAENLDYLQAAELIVVFSRVVLFRNRAQDPRMSFSRHPPMLWPSCGQGRPGSHSPTLLRKT